MPVLVVTPTIIATSGVMLNTTVEGLSLPIIAPRPSLTLAISSGVILPLTITASRPTLALTVSPGVSLSLVVTASRPSLTLATSSGVILPLTITASRPTLALTVSPGVSLSLVVTASRPTLAVMVLVSHPTAIVAPSPSLKLVFSSGITLPLAITAKRPVAILAGVENTILAVRFTPGRPLLSLGTPTGLIASVIFRPLRPRVLLSGLHGAAMTLSLRALRPVLLLAGGSSATFPVSFVSGRPVLVLVGSVPLNETYQAWVMNTQTTGHAQYENFGFKAFAKHQGKYYGCNASGIFELTGTLDHGVKIDARILTGISNLGAEGLKYVPDAYLKVRGEGTLELSIITGETQRVDYAVDYREGQQGVHTKRCKLAKGVIGEHWQAEIRNVSGGDFDIAVLELVTVPTRRR